MQKAKSASRATRAHRTASIFGHWPTVLFDCSLKTKFEKDEFYVMLNYQNSEKTKVENLQNYGEFQPLIPALGIPGNSLEFPIGNSRWPGKREARRAFDSLITKGNCHILWTVCFQSNDTAVRSWEDAISVVTWLAG